MKDLFNRLIRSIHAGGERDRDRRQDEPVRFGRESLRLLEEGRHLQAVDDARRLVEHSRERSGEHHPDHAAALTELALLLQSRGDLNGAEPLLRQALAIRETAVGGNDPHHTAALDRLADLLRLRGDLPGAEPLLRLALAIRGEALGDRHPDYAASLSRLGSLLFDRGDHASAEPLLRQAVSIRKDGQDTRHPDNVADLRSLEAIIQARSLPTLTATVADGRGPATGVVAIPASASDSALEQLGRGPRDIAAEARGLAETFARLGAALEETARGMRQGFPPQFSLLNDSALCLNAFGAVHDEAVRRAEALDLAPVEGTPLGLHDLADLMDRVARVEDEIPGRIAALRRALGVIDRALGLRHRVASESPLLDPCHGAAAALRAALADARVSVDLPPDASRLADGSHPLAALIRLIDPETGLMSDDDWSRLRDEVVTAFGRPLAAAAVRGRLVPAVG